MGGRPHPGSERPLHGLLQAFDLEVEAARLREENERREGRRNSITLRKAPGLQMVLLSMQAGDRLSEHQAPEPISLHTISGKLRFATADESVELGPQMVVALDGKVPHTVEALEESICLLTIGSPA